MKKKLDMKSLAIGVFLGVGIVFSVAAAAPKRTVWEYKTIDRWVEGDDSSALAVVINQSIEEGWEFVSASAGSGDYTGRGFAVLKRKKKFEEK